MNLLLLADEVQGTA